MIKISKTIKQNIRFVTKVSNLSPTGIRFDEVKTGNRLANQRSTPKGAKLKFDERTPN